MRTVKPAARPRILFLNDEPEDDLTPFIRQDIEILKKHFEVEYKSTACSSRCGWYSRLFHPGLWKVVWRSDLVFVWFGWNARYLAVAKALGKPSVVIAGGADITSVPEIGYGLKVQGRSTLFFSTLGFRFADRVLLFSGASLRDFAKLPGIRAGKGEVLYLSVDTDFFKPAGIKTDTVLTVAYLSANSYHRKGLSTFIETARITPEIEFMIVGKIVDRDIAAKIASEKPANLTFLADEDNEKILRDHFPAIFQKAKIYLQLSYHEGFGVSMAEAMSCGCIPIVTKVGAIPEVVGDTGRYVPVNDPVAARQAILDCLATYREEMSVRARKRIVDLYSLSAREAGLLSAIRPLLPHGAC